MIKIINYGSGNIYAIGTIYKRLNIPFQVAENPSDLGPETSHIILPGVGAFDETMRQLNKSGLRDKLEDFALGKRTPIIGICVGMQILAKNSEEGSLPGLGWIDGYVRKLDESKLNRKPHLPHLGWNAIKPTAQHTLLDSIDHQRGFYFLHSYYFQCEKDESVLCTTDYGINFASGVANGNILGVQFHPEKSHNNGIQLLKNFCQL